MIKCPKCGADNLIGAIFCRQCGDKLNIEDLRPDDIEKATRTGAGKRIGQIIRNIVVLLLMVFLGLLLVMVALPASFEEPGNLGADEIGKGDRKVRAFLRGRGKPEVTFDEAELSALAAERLGLTEEAKIERATEGEDTGLLVPDRLIVNVTDNGQIRLTLKSMLFRKVRVYMQTTGTVSAEGAGVEFAPDSVSLGRLPIPLSFLQKPILGQFTALLDDAGTLQPDVLDRVGMVKVNPPSEVTVSR